MLVVVRKDQPKIAMGLLSYLPRLQTVAAVQREVEWYRAQDQRELLLWQDPETQHYVAVLGVEKLFNTVVLRLIVFGSEVPITNRAAMGADIYQYLQSRYPDYVIMGTIATQPQLTVWREAVHG